MISLDLSAVDEGEIRQLKRSHQRTDVTHRAKLYLDDPLCETSDRR